MDAIPNFLVASFFYPDAPIAAAVDGTLSPQKTRHKSYELSYSCDNDSGNMEVGYEINGAMQFIF